MKTYNERFLDAYIECALWSSTDEYDQPLDAVYTRDDLTDETVQKMRDECEDFITANWELLKDEEPEKAGHHFWLTRNRHGAGYWDGDYEETIGRKLTDAAHVYGSSDLYVGDDGNIYLY